MRKLPAALCALLLVPAMAQAAEGGGPDLAGTLAQTVGSLILVIGVILILYWLAGKFMKMPQGRGASRYIRVIETRPLAPKKSLMLVEVSGEYLLLSSSGEGLSFIKQIEMLEEIEVVDERGYATLIPDQLKNRLKALAGDLARGRAPVVQLNKNGGFA